MIDLNAQRPSAAANRNLDAIVAGLRETAADWATRLFPNGRRVGNDLRLASIRGDAPRKSGSCVIALRGARAGDWFDFDGGEGGGPLCALQWATGFSGDELYSFAAEVSGVAPGAPRREPSRPSKRPKDSARQISGILRDARPAQGTAVQSYLEGRGLALPDGADLLFHPALKSWDDGSVHPAMLGLIRDRDDVVIGLHRTYLGEDGDGRVGKAVLEKPRMMLGAAAGGAVRLGAARDDAPIAFCEGIETGLAAMTACPGLVVWAALSTSGLQQLAPPAGASRVLILADHDASGAGARAAETAAKRMRSGGSDVVIALPPREGDDFNDLLLREGPEAVAKVIEDAAAPPATAAPGAGRRRPLHFAEPGGRRPEMRADEGDLARALDQTWSLLLASNHPPWLYCCAGRLTCVVPDDEGRPVAAALCEDRLRQMLARLGDWRRMNGKGELVPTMPPMALVKSVLATPDPDPPVLTAIVNTPVFGRSGALLTTPGYHPDARLLYAPAPGFEIEAIPARPSAQEINEARALLVEDLFGDFPFVAPAERAHAVALLLLGFLRGMIDGPTPLHLIEKPSPGTGATLMVDAIATILTGAAVGVMTEGRDDEEWRKRLTAKLRGVPSILLIDNMRRMLDSSAVAAALTAPFWEDRILGQSEMVRLPVRCAWIATGNNPEVSQEIARRLVRIRLNADVDRPWMRSGFRHPDLMGWVRVNRARIVAACLTLCQAWIAKGRPSGSRAIGSFEAWARTLGGVLETVGVEGFLGNLDETMAASDGEGAAWGEFVAAWWKRYCTMSVGVGALFDLAIACDTPPAMSGYTDRAQKTSFGIALTRRRDQVFRVGDVSLRIVTAGVAHRAKQWRLEAVEAAPHPNPPHARRDSGEPRSGEGNLASGGSPPQPAGLTGKGEPGEPFSAPSHMRAPAHARVHAREDRERGSPGSPGSPNLTNSETCEGEPPGEPRDDPRRGSPVPAWLREVDE